MRAATLTTICCLSVANALAQTPDIAGRPIVDVIEDLRDQGTRIVYSPDLLPPRLRVESEPAAAEAFERLGEVLAPHGLGVELGPRGTWLIVRQQEPAFPGAQAAAAPPGFVLVPPSLETIVVTTSRYAIERPSAISANTIGRHMLENTPALGQDPLRVAQILPGISSNQLTSQMHIRGGDLDEVSVRLDGVTLYNPYHLKDFQNIFSSINPRVIESIDVRTGGYEARLGEGLSGIVEMTSVVPTEFRHYELGLSFLETSVLSSGLFDQGRGSWVTSLRRGNLDQLSESGDSNIGTPQYVDFFNKLQYSLNSRSTIGIGMLSLDDKISLREGATANATADYDDTYYWLSLRQRSETGLEATYQFSSANLGRTRSGNIDDPNRASGDLSERRQLDRSALTADWVYSLTDSRQLSWGLEFATVDLDYGFQSETTELLEILANDLTGPSSPPMAIRIRPGQTTRAFYLSYRTRLTPRLVTEIGARRDDQSLTGEQQTSPRINMLFDITDRTSLRAAWGEFSQSHSLDRMEVSDGITSLQRAEESEHMVLGLEHLFGDTTALRFETYSKRISRVNSRFENLFERVSLIPELLPDRFRIDPLSAKVTGFEIGIEGGSSPFNWWANYSRSRTEEQLPSGQYRRSWDEIASLKAGGEWSGSRWTVTAKATYRSGWPISTLEFTNGDVVSESFNALRLPDFSSVDVRASQAIDSRRGAMIWFFEVSNLFDHANYCCIDYRFVPANGNEPDALPTEVDELLGIVPNIGIRWEF